MVQWGVMATDYIVSRRRTRTLGLGRTIRKYNEDAVPGLGQLRYLKQLLWPLMGLRIASRLKLKGVTIRKIVLANAIEAMACLSGLLHHPPNGDYLPWEEHSWRIKGKQKLIGKKFCPFAVARRSSFYVTQPMRSGVVDPLSKLGLVNPDAGRFSGFEISEKGMNLLEASCAGSYDSLENYSYDSLENYFYTWVTDEKDFNSTPAKAWLNPLLPPDPRACTLLLQLLCKDPKRTAALAWLRTISAQNVGWESPPPQITPEHWHQIREGALFFEARDAALAVLTDIESQVDRSGKKAIRLQEAPTDNIPILRQACQQFLDNKPTDDSAQEFCMNCLQEDSIAVIAYLLTREQNVLTLADTVICPGPSFRAGIASDNPQDEEETDEMIDEEEESYNAEEKDSPFANLPYISYRLPNLYELQRDLEPTLG